LGAGHLSVSVSNYIHEGEQVLGFSPVHYPLIKITEVNHDKDHLHLLISIPPTMSVGKAIGIIKQNTARNLKKKFTHIKKIYWGTEAIWSEDYFVSTVGINEAIIQRYIENQGKKDSGQMLFNI